LRIARIDPMRKQWLAHPVHFGFKLI